MQPQEVLARVSYLHPTSVGYVDVGNPGFGHAGSQQSGNLHLREQEGNAAKQAYVRFTGDRKKGATAFVGCQKRTPFDTMEANLWLEILGRCLGSHD